MGEPKGPVNRDVDEYLHRGRIDVSRPETNAGLDDARAEIWHVHAKPGDVVMINRDDPRSRDVIKHDEGGKFLALSRQDFLARGGRIGYDQDGNPYPPYTWKSHPNVPTYEQTGPVATLPPVRRDRDIDVDVDVDMDRGRRRVRRTRNDDDCDDQNGGTRRRVRYPHVENWDPNWQGTNASTRRHGYPHQKIDPYYEGQDPYRGQAGRYPWDERYPGDMRDGPIIIGGRPHQRIHRGNGVSITLGNEDFGVTIGVGNGHHNGRSRMRIPHGFGW